MFMRLFTMTCAENGCASHMPLVCSDLEKSSGRKAAKEEAAIQ